MCLEVTAGALRGNGARRRAPFPLSAFSSIRCFPVFSAASARKSGGIPDTFPADPCDPSLAPWKQLPII